jgi:hypothetical protein
MAILTERKSWKRELSEFARLRKERTTLTVTEQTNVRRALRVLVRRFGGVAPLAQAMGMSPAALIKAKQPSRTPSPRLALQTARAAGITIDAVLAGELPMPVPCPTCGGCGHVFR